MQIFDINQIEQENIVETCLFVMEIKTIFTIPLYTIAFFCIFWRSKNLQHHYRVMLGFHVLLCLCEEVCGFILMRPIVFLPVIGIYADGILSNIFHIHPFIQIVVFFLLLHFNAGIILHICLFRLKVIIPMSYRHYSLVVKIGRWFLIFMYFFCISSTSIFLLLLEDQNEAKLQISQTVSPLPTMFWSEKYVVSTAKSDNFYLFLHACLFFVISNLAVGCSVVFTAFCILYRTKSHISAKVVEAQKAYLKVLMIQVAVIILFLILPFSLFGFSMKYELQSLPTLLTSLVLVMSHGSFSTLTLILGTKSYRQEVTRIFSKCKRFSCSNRHLLPNNVISSIS